MDEGEPGGGRPTVRDVARAAGVSASTVSNVLNDRPYVAADKRERVLAAVETLGYLPSFASRALRGQRTDVVALAVPDITSPYFSSLAHAFVGEAARLGIALFLDETGGEIDRERVIARGYPSRGVGGVVFCPVTITAEELERDKSGIPTVLLGEYVLGGGTFDHISIDSRRSAADVARHLVDQGMTRLAFVGARLDRATGPGHLRWAGTRDACAAAGHPLDPSLVVDLEHHTREEGARAAFELLPRLVDVDAIVCGADIAALGLMTTLQDAGVRIPDDVAVVSWDDAPEARWARPPLTSVEHDLPSLAARAFGAIEARRRAPADPAVQLLVRHRLVVRASSERPRS